MTYTFNKAVREKVGLLIGLSGASGSGKTYSAMRLASGISGDKPFAVIDTENRRALHYADMFNFDHTVIHPPFTPQEYVDAIKAAVDAKYPVIIVDSISHSWAGEGGGLDMQEAELKRMAGDDYKKREACKMAAWIKPKRENKKMVNSMLQLNATIILCYRAEQKVGMEKDSRGKTVIVDKGWQPICEKSLPFEMTASFLLVPEHPGLPQPLKLQEQHKSLFPADKQLNEESGRHIAEWAAGGAVAEPEQGKKEDSAAPSDKDWRGMMEGAENLEELADLWGSYQATKPGTESVAKMGIVKDRRKTELMGL